MHRENVGFDSERKLGGGIGCIFPLVFILGWIVYGSFSGGLFTALMTIPLGILPWLTGWIPVAGLFIYWFVANRWIMPLFPSFGLEFTWVTNLLLWTGLMMTGLMNLVVIISFPFFMYSLRFEKKAKKFVRNNLPNVLNNWDLEQLQKLSSIPYGNELSREPVRSMTMDEQLWDVCNHLLEKRLVNIL